MVCYLGDGVLVSEDAEEELGGGLSLAVCDWTVAVHDQVLLDPRRQVLLPARLHDTHTHTVRLTPRPRQTSRTESGADPAAVVHAAQRRHQLHAAAPWAQAHWAGGGGARRRLRVQELESGSHDDGVRVVGVPLHQQVHVPLTVNEEVLGPVQVQTQRPRNLRGQRGHLTHLRGWRLRLMNL